MKCKRVLWELAKAVGYHAYHCTYRIHSVDGGDTWSLVYHIDGRLAILFKNIRVVNDDKFVLMKMTGEDTCDHMRRIARDDSLE